MHTHTHTRTHTQFEFMELAEELETEPVWVTNVGISQSESSTPEELILDGWLQVSFRCMLVYVTKQDLFR